MQESALIEAVSQGIPESWTWQAGLRRPNEPHVFCCGVLIGSSWVLTAGNCVYAMKDFVPTPLIEVIIGEKDLRNKDGVASNVTEVFLTARRSCRTRPIDVHSSSQVAP